MAQFPSQSSASGLWTLKKQKRAAQGLNWPPLLGPADDYFEYVTMLLPGNGTNGAQNNTFLDSSTNNFTITRNGNTTQGTFAPYGNNWSNAQFSGSAYLTYNPGATAAFGTGDFTVEAWVFATDALSSGDNPYICDTRGGGGAWSFSWNYNGTSNPWQLAWANSSVLQSSTSMNINTWNHCAYVRSGTTGTLYLNGVSIGTWTDNYNYSASVSSITIGRRYTLSTGTQYLPGYLSNLRIVKGTAVYTSAFTPPTAPLSAITNTVLLTCQSNRFIDNSANAFTITRNGNVSVQRFSPFSPTAPYAAGTDGGSGYFDGTGDYLTTSSNTSMDFGTGNFTIEGWFFTGDKSVSVGASRTIIGNSGNSYTMQVYLSTSGFMTFGNTGSTFLQGSTDLANNAWHHFAISRSGTGSNQIAMWVDGTRVAQGTNSQNYTSGTIYLGGFDNASGFWNGYVSNLRIVKGTAVYDPSNSTITVPTAPFTAITNTQLLLNFTNAGIIDNAEMNNLETVGNAQISTSVSKFGGGSLAFDGSGDALRALTTPNLIYGSGDVTIEAWVYLNTIAGSPQVIVDTRASSAGSELLNFQFQSGVLYVYAGAYSLATELIAGTSAISATTWTHVAFVRSSGTNRLFVNGTQQSSNTNAWTQVLNSGTLTSVGMVATSTGNPMNGYIDDLRITKGYARYTTNFTPPTAPFPLY